MSGTRRLPWEVWGRDRLDGLQAWADRAAWSRFGFAFLMFGIKQAYACLFGGAMLGLILATFSCGRTTARCRATTFWSSGLC